jgi:hypothetical protein
LGYCAIGPISSTTAQTKAEKIDQLMNTYSQYEQFNGSILVAEHGKSSMRRFWNGKYGMEST